MWAGITLAEGSTLNPNYWQTQQRGYTRARHTRQQTAPDPSGYMGVNVAFALLPWGPLRASVPDKWLLLVTAVGAPQDSDAAYKTRHQYTASTTEAGHTATGAVGKTCQRAHTTTGEQQPTTTRPQPTSRPAPAPKPQPPQGEPTSPGETDQSSYMQSSAKTSRAMPGKASSQDTEAGRDCQRQQRGQPARAAAMARLWLRELAATLQGGATQGGRRTSSSCWPARTNTGRLRQTTTRQGDRVAPQGNER